MKKILLLFAAVLSSLLIVSCGNSTPDITPSLPVIEFTNTFESTQEGWNSSFFGPSSDATESFNFKSGLEAIPDLESKGLLLSATSSDAGLVMYVQKQLTGFVANQDYNLLYKVGLASNLSSDTACEGFQGKRTVVKITAGEKEPKKVLAENLEILDLGTGPFQRIGVVGHKSRNCEDTNFAINTLSNLTPPFNSPVKITSDAQGKIWAAIVLDSSYIGQSKFYIDSIEITATPIE